MSRILHAGCIGESWPLIERRVLRSRIWAVSRAKYSPTPNGRDSLPKLASSGRFRQLQRSSFFTERSHHEMRLRSIQFLCITPSTRQIDPWLSAISSSPKSPKAWAEVITLLIKAGLLLDSSAAMDLKTKYLGFPKIWEELRPSMEVRVKGRHGSKFRQIGKTKQYNKDKKEHRTILWWTGTGMMKHEQLQFLMTRQEARQHKAINLYPTQFPPALKA